MLADLGTSSPARDNIIQRVPSLRWAMGKEVSVGSEYIVVEAALCIEVAYARGASAVVKTLGITMRTPGLDEELVLGFLRGEGIVSTPVDVLRIENLLRNSAGETIDTCRVFLAQPPRNDLQRASRAVTTTSACGLCGRTTLEGLPLDVALSRANHFPPIPGGVISRLPEKLRTCQTAFAETGGCHGAGVFEFNGSFVLGREDVGRHNAVDKLFGAAFQQDLALPKLILVLSGRASFELVQKASAVGISIIVAVGAPSSAAVNLAHSTGIALIGFTRENRFNIYTHASRVALE